MRTRRTARAIDVRHGHQDWRVYFLCMDTLHEGSKATSKRAVCFLVNARRIVSAAVLRVPPIMSA